MVFFPEERALVDARYENSGNFPASRRQFLLVMPA
jgi:hypothetical protein